jgi:hypothetical protein
MNILLKTLARTGLLHGDLIPFFTHGPLTFWMYPGLRNKGIRVFPGRFRVAVRRPFIGKLLEQKARGDWRTRFGSYLYCDDHNHPIHAGRLGPSARGFPAMVGNVAFLMKDLVLLAVSFYLLKQDVARIVSAQPSEESKTVRVTVP